MMESYGKQEKDQNKRSYAFYYQNEKIISIQA